MLMYLQQQNLLSLPDYVAQGTSSLIFYLQYVIIDSRGGSSRKTKLLYVRHFECNYACVITDRAATCMSIASLMKPLQYAIS